MYRRKRREAHLLGTKKADELSDILELHEKWLDNGRPTATEKGQRADLSGLNLDGTDFKSRNLSYASFDNSSLVKAIFTDSNLTRATMVNTDLSGAYFDNAALCDVVADAATLANTTFTDALLIESRFDGAEISDSHFENADLYNASFRKALIRETDFSGATLNYANFDGVRTHGIVVTATTIDHVSLRKAKLFQANFSDSDFVGCDMRSSSMLDANLHNASLGDCDLTRADFRVQGHSRFILDRCVVLQTGFSPGGKDLWSILRREYSSGRSWIIFALTLFSLLPAFIEAIRWRGIMQEMLITPLATGVLPEGYHEYKMWEVVMAALKGPPILTTMDIVLFLTCILILYNLVRSYVTLKIQLLSYEEDRSHITPAEEEYRGYFQLHNIVLKNMAYLGFFAIGLRLLLFATETVWIPGSVIP